MKSPKILLAITLLVTALLAPAHRLPAEDAAAKYYELEADQKLISEVTLKPGESKPFEIAAKIPLMVGFETDISAADNTAYAYPKPSVTLRSKQSEITSPKGASSLWEPHGGKIALKIENKTKLTLKIALYQGPKPADWTGDAMP